MKKVFLVLPIIILLIAISTGNAISLPINVFADGSQQFSFTNLIDFNLFQSPSTAWIYTQNLYLDGAGFSEHFSGQTVSIEPGTVYTNYLFDVLSGVPTNPLELEAGERNIEIAGFGYESPALFGLNPTSVGEGSIAVLFDIDQSQLGFDWVGLGGGYGGPAYLQFFARSGTLIDYVTLDSIHEGEIAFSRENNVADIAGFSIHNGDFAGLGIDNLRFGSPVSVPEPSSLMLLAMGIISLIIYGTKINVG